MSPVTDTELAGWSQRVADVERRVAEVELAQAKASQHADEIANLRKRVHDLGSAVNPLTLTWPELLRVAKSVEDLRVAFEALRGRIYGALAVATVLLPAATALAVRLFER